MGKPGSVTATIQFPGTTYLSVKESKLKKRTKILHGPRKVALFCIYGIFTPALLISIPLIMRFVVYGKYETVLSPSDMKILDNRISTIWCKSQIIRMNSSFTAYLTDGEPELVQATEPILIQKNLIVPDDHKEYWGFYLHRGTKYRISACAKFKGGTLLIVKGRNTLQHCAYIGNEDSNGNSDEFSNSNSGSVEVSRGNNRTVISVTKSQEDLSHILKKIRHFVKSHPKRYRKLKDNLFQIFSSSSSNETILTEPMIETGKISQQRHKREIQITSNQLEDSNEIGASEDLGDEEDRSTHHEHIQHTGIFNQSTPNDGSNSESESSYSSSEEALARCEGIIANLRIPHSNSCDGSGSYFVASESINSSATVNSSAYYYFIFGSENEKTDNFLVGTFELEKFEYRLPHPLTNCTGVKECRVGLDFSSNQKILISIPSPPVDQDRLWDKTYVVETDCEPRTHLYLIFILLVPIVLLMCAFQ